jgi:hypothetical protein
MRTSSRLALVLAVAVVCAAGAAEALAAPGAFVWKKTPNPTAGEDALSLCAPGPAGSVYVAGTTGAYPDGDIWVALFKPGGGVAWSRTWDGPDALHDTVSGIAVDGDGNVYACGYASRPGGLRDSAILKYDAAGTLQWATVYAAGAGYDVAAAVAVDRHGGVYVAGTSAPAPGSGEIYTARFRASDGQRDWTSLYAGAKGTGASSIVVTGAGDCYVGGQTGSDYQHLDAVLVKTSASGSQLWAEVWSGPAGLSEWWSSVAPVRGGGVVVAGTTGYDGPSDFAAARYTSAGLRTWARTWSSPGSWGDRMYGLAAARDGSVWVGGSTDREEGDMRGALVKWSASGRRLFSRAVGSARVAAEVHGVTVDAKGNAYLGGAMMSGGGGWDLLAAKYSPAGRRLWRSTAGFAGSEDTLKAICLGGPGYVYAAGVAGWEGADSRGVVVKLRR